MKASYQLLGILQAEAPNGAAQQDCAAYYHELQASFEEREVAARMAGCLVDGYRYGNWPWTVAS